VYKVLQGQVVSYKKERILNTQVVNLICGKSSFKSAHCHESIAITRNVSSIPQTATDQKKQGIQVVLNPSAFWLYNLTRIKKQN